MSHLNSNQAFVLITCKQGKRKHVQKEIEANKEIKHTDCLYGTYDVVAKVEALSEGDLQQVIHKKIRMHPDVKSTLSLGVLN